MYPSLSPWLPLSRHFLGKSAHLSNCWFLIPTPASPSPLVRYMCAAGHSTYQIRKLVLIQLENNIFFFFFDSFFPKQFSDSVSPVATQTHCARVMEEMAEEQGQVAEDMCTTGDLSSIITGRKRRWSRRSAQAVVWYPSGSAGSSAPCAAPSPSPLPPACKWLRSCTCAWRMIQ